jgi:ankyrin repeat protein
MPTKARYIENLENYPALYSFVHGAEPSSELIRSLKAQYILKLNMHYAFSPFSLLSILSLYGKKNCIESLSLSSEAIKDEIKANDYYTYRLAAVNGHTETIKYLETHLTGSEKKEAVKTCFYDAIRVAGQNGHIDTIKHLESHLTDPEKKQAVQALHYGAIHCAALNGQIDIIKHLESYLNDSEKKWAIISDGCDLIPMAAGKGQLDAIKYLEHHLTPIEKKVAVKAKSYEAIQNAAQYGHIETIKHLETHLSRVEKKASVKASDYRAIRLAAENGHLKTIKHLETYLNRDEKKEAVKFKDHESIQKSARNGHIEVIKYLETHLTPDEKKAAVHAGGFLSIHRAAQNGHINVIKYLENRLTDTEKKAAVKALNYNAIRWASHNGHPETIKYLETHLTSAEKKEAIKVRHYDAIRRAATNGHILTIKHLESYLTDPEKKEAVKAEGYESIRSAACIGRIDLIKYLETHLTGAEKKGAVKALNYHSIGWSARKGYVDLIKHFESYLSDTEKKEALKANDYYPIRLAAQNGHIDVINYFLSQYSTALSYMERHDREYGETYVYSFVSDTLLSLKERASHFERDNPNGVFDSEDINEAEICFYMLRNLIRRREGNGNQEERLDDIRFLLSIPAVRSLAHECVNEGQANELVRLAIRIGNQGAAILLMQIPAVRSLASQNRFYQGEADGDLDLDVIAHDSESSMVALSISERSIVDKVRYHYQTKIDDVGGIHKVFESLKAALKTRYESHPAVISLPTGNKGEYEEIALPFEWDALQILRAQLSKDQYDDALKAYYQHVDHTVYRYLSKPNYWMAPNASYVYLYEENGHRTIYRYANFEEYIGIIVPFYLAVIDKSAKPVDGFTFDDRINAFIKQLALIGRAHNWDGSREINVAGKRLTEEYDDLEGDKPSCYSGVNRRLFQSVLGHPFFKPLNKTIVAQTLNEKVREYYGAVLSLDKAKEIQKAYEALVMYSFDDITKEEACARLKSVNIPSDKKNEMISELLTQLAVSYGETVESLTQSYMTLLLVRFQNTESLGGDFISFACECGLHKLLEKIINAPTQSPSDLLRSHGVFSTSRVPLVETSDNEAIVQAQNRCRNSDSV